MKCETCGEEFKPKNSGQKYCCLACYLKAKYRKRAQRFNAERAHEQKAVNDATVRNLQKKLNTRSFADWQREAAECNMDYGNYRAQIEVFGKTYEELKATADRRQVPNHAHGHRGLSNS